MELSGTIKLARATPVPIPTPTPLQPQRERADAVGAAGTPEERHRAARNAKTGPPSLASARLCFWVRSAPKSRPLRERGIACFVQVSPSPQTTVTQYNCTRLYATVRLCTHQPRPFAGAARDATLQASSGPLREEAGPLHGPLMGPLRTGAGLSSRSRTSISGLTLGASAPGSATAGQTEALPATAALPVELSARTRGNSGNRQPMEIAWSTAVIINVVLKPYVLMR